MGSKDNGAVRNLRAGTDAEFDEFDHGEPAGESVAPSAAPAPPAQAPAAAPLLAQTTLRRFGLWFTLSAVGHEALRAAANKQ
eukprot:7954722-Alexandrium_andersonii.AAC.1